MAALAVEGQVTAPGVASQLYFPDVKMYCNPMESCSANGNPPPNRGLCIIPGGNGGTTCWDVCNPNHKPSDFVVASGGEASVLNHISQGMVGEVREGLNSAVTCPAALNLASTIDKCPPGTPCPDSMRKQYKIAQGQGLCVVEPGNANGRKCLDMCNFKIPADEFSRGAPQGVALEVLQFRSSGSCNQKPWLAWLIGILVTLAILGVCAVGVLNYRKRIRKSWDRSDANVEASEEMLEPLQGSTLEDDQQGDNDASYAENDTEYGPAPPSFSQQVASAQPSSSAAMGSAYHQREASGSGSFRHGSASSSFQQPAYNSSSSMRIPGLDEPILPMPQPFAMPQTNIQAGLPNLPTLVSPTSVAVGGVLGNTYPAVVAGGSPSYRTTSAIPQGSFQTQLAAFSTQLPQAPSGYMSPQGSIQISAGAQKPLTYLQGAMPRMG